MHVCVIQDEYENVSGLSLNGKLHVEVINSCHVDEVPVLVGNTTRLQLTLLQGRVTVQVCVNSVQQPIASHYVTEISHLYSSRDF